MKRRSQVATAICQELTRCGIKYIDIAKSSGITHGAISQIVSHGFRLSPGTLKKLTHAWPEPLSNVRILIAHLMDEIDRAGHKSEQYLIEHREGLTLSKDSFENDVDFLRRASVHVPVIRALISELCEVARAELPPDMVGTGEKDEKLIAAEKREGYDCRRKSKGD